MTNKPSEIQEMLDINSEQSVFYNRRKPSVFTRVWSTLRGRLSHFRGELDMKHAIYDLHRQWYGDLTGKRVLDFGCGRGNLLMPEMARASADYLAIDISEKAIATVNRKIEENDLPNARAEVVDILAMSDDETFDVIYAHSVLHHFKHFDVMLEKLAAHLNDDGIIVAYDPLNTALLSRIIRAIYRPFQDDKEWEWPFTRASFDTIQKHFVIEEVQGVLGHSKWMFPIYLILPEVGGNLGRKAHQRDMQEATEVGPGLFRCMQVAMLLRKK